ncbi:MAG: DNA-directed RNA polymerase [Candidatus Hadarchaeales archaeon]
MKIEDTVRVPPDKFSEPIESAVIDILRKTYVGIADKDVGVILAITKVEKIGEGRIIMGDGASHHDVVFEALVFKPELDEVVLGEIVDITDFGAFVRIGPLDGLVHISQVMDDYISHDRKKGILIGKEKKLVLKVGDHVRARIMAIGAEKIGMTMRQPGLGKLEWLEKEGKS